MIESWGTGSFWFNDAARRPFDIKPLLKRCLVKDSAGIKLLGEEARAGMVAFVHVKMQLRAYDEECKLLL